MVCGGIYSRRVLQHYVCVVLEQQHEVKLVNSKHICCDCKIEFAVYHSVYYLAELFVGHKPHDSQTVFVVHKPGDRGRVLNPTNNHSHLLYLLEQLALLQITIRRKRILGCTRIRWGELLKCRILPKQRIWSYFLVTYLYRLHFCCLDVSFLRQFENLPYVGCHLEWK